MGLVYIFFINNVSRPASQVSEHKHHVFSILFSTIFLSTGIVLDKVLLLVTDIRKVECGIGVTIWFWEIG